MSSTYDDVVRGGLKLKGSKLNTVSDGKVKKKKKKSSSSTATDKNNSSASSSSTSQSQSRVDLNSSSSAKNQKPVVVVSKTAAELKFEEIQRKRLREKIKKQASKSHKEKVEEFNEYLDKLSEHYDIPKVGPG
ncbi:hypothetical protein BKA69DRAFT_1122636 [Paraphysoderma sedebokerense]|nr:hypothetical protein BKA69DRAFT_1122636 [Paraphysoderma sedebokerense]